MIETTIKGDKKRRKFHRDENPPKRIETKPLQTECNKLTCCIEANKILTDHSFQQQQQQQQHKTKMEK